MSAPPPAAGGWLRDAAARFGDACAVECGDLRWSFAELAAASSRTRSVLEASGLVAGSVVALLAENGVVWPRWLHACEAMGVTLLPLNARLSVEEIAFQLADARVGAWVVGADVEPARVESVAARAPEPSVLHVDAFGELQGGGAAPRRDGGAGVAPVAPPPPLAVLPVAPPAPLAVLPVATPPPLAVLYTSGTTGRPKGVQLPAAAFAASAHASQQGVPLAAGDRWLVCMPLFHVGGLSILVRCALAGATALVHAGFDASAVADAIEQRGVTHVSLVPTMLTRLLDVRGGAPAPPSLRSVLLGGAAADSALIERAWALGYPVQPSYGLTEACSQVATRVPGDREPPATGRLVVLDGVELSLRGPADAGEIFVRGPMVTPGYVGHAAGRSPVDADGWLATGDLGRLDAGGRLEVVDRRDDLIVSGGENVYPAEVERVLEAHPGVAEVAVVGRADATWGARPIAYLVRGGGVPLEDLGSWARERLAAYKVPVAFFEVAALPRTASGKLRRAALRRGSPEGARPIGG